MEEQNNISSNESLESSNIYTTGLSKKERNIQNNAQNVRVAADVASKSANPYAKAIGTAIKTADKFSDGRASEKLGKKINTLNKITPGGRMAQGLLNKMSESGTSARIGDAMNKKNSAGSNPVNAEGKNNAAVKNKDNSFFSRKETEEQTSDGGGVSFQATVKFLKIALIAFAPVMVVVVFMCLFVAASQTFLQVIGLGQADKVSDADADKAIRENGSQGLDDEINDGDPEVTAFIMPEDFFIEDSFNYQKFKNINFIASTKNREYNEADLTQLEDYYSGINNYQGNNYNMDTVYKFFFKLFYIQRHYKTYYNVDLDMPLIMSILSVKSEEKEQVFISNIEAYKLSKTQEDNIAYENFDINKDWSDYISTKENSKYDIEILAQNMVSKTSDNGCVVNQFNSNGACYKLVEEDEYKEFLRKFLREKYYGDGFRLDEGNLNNSNNSNVCSNSFTKYNLTDDQVKQIASLAYHEQGTAKGAAAEASLMANLFELKGSKYGTGAAGLYNYIRTSGWFYNAANYMDSYDASNEIVAVVKSVLVDGKRTLPAYIDEHDYFGDITSAQTNGKDIMVNDRSKYEKNNTSIKNKYGAKYTFYSFPDTNSDPFGYTSESIRQSKGEFYYDYDTGNPVGCNNEISSNSSNSIFAEAFIELAGKELELNKGKNGAKYNKYFSYSESTPWCANFVSYLIDNTKVNGISMYPSIIDYKTASTGSFMKHFNNSKKSNLKFYYNSSCKNLKDKNNNSIYFPKKGDLIFFDWQQTFESISTGGQDHVGIVEKYENGFIYTIEGNYGNELKRNKYNIKSCMVIGFGSWY